MPQEDDIRTNYGLFYLACEPSYNYAYFQQELLAPVYERIVAGDPMMKRVAVNMAFRHSKTDMGTKKLIPFIFGHHPTATVILLAYQKALARSFGREIRDLMRSDFYAELFPQSVIKKTSRASDEFETVSGGKFFAGGFDTGVNGRGANYFIVDDPHKNKEDVTSETIITKWKSIYNNVARTRLEPGGSILVNSTRWAPQDLMGWRYSEDGAWDYLQNCPYTDNDAVAPKAMKPTWETWQVVRLAAEATEDEGWRKAHCGCGLVDREGNPDPHGQILWPERWSCREMMALRRADPEVWETSYQARPTVGGGYWFASIPLNFYEQTDKVGRNIYMLVDPALRQHGKADYTTIWIVATAPDRNYYWLEMIRKRLTPAERADTIFRMHRKWRPIAVGYEEYGLQSDIAALQEKMERENYRFTITELGRSGVWHNKSKSARISTLIPVGRDGRLWLPNPETRGRDPEAATTVKQFIEEEWNRYPGVNHDDMLDVMSRINDPAMNIAFPRPVDHDETFNPRLYGTTWMSA